MFKEKILLLCGMAISLTIVAQNRPLITATDFGKWPSVSNCLISNDGNYSIYFINDPGAGTGSTVIQSIHDNWKMEVGPSPCQFTGDSRYAVFKNTNDSIGVLNLSDKKINYIPGAISFKLSGKCWLAYILKSSQRLVTKNIETGKDISFEMVSNYQFNNEGDLLLVELMLQNKTQAVQWVNPESNKRITIWTSGNSDTKAGHYIFSKTGNAVAFVAVSKAGKAIWYFAEGTDSAVKIADEHTPGIDKNLFIDGIDYRGFTEDGKNLLINLKDPDRPKSGPGVDVWSYTDVKLQSQQLKQLKTRQYLAVLNIGNGNSVRIEQLNEQTIAVNNAYAIVANMKGEGGAYDEWSWNKEAKTSVYLVDLNDGTRRLINDGYVERISNCYWFSPEGRYLIYYDGGSKNYFSYEVATGIKRNITSPINTEWTTYVKRDVPNAPYMPIYCGMAGWIKDDKAVLLYDQYDIYEVDPSGKMPPVSITNAYGLKHNIELRVAIESNQVFKDGENIIISAFDRNTKEDGFFRVQSGRQKTPELLSMQPFLLKGTWENDDFGAAYPIKAKDAEVYLVKRMSAEESPNYFWTNDFKTFNRITDVHPERNYNWITSELITWKLPDGSLSQGILYKPENFDPKKKYPLIFNYYENSTESLHGFLVPEVSHSSLEIPYYVSNGYLVFKPDIHYKIGHPGQSVVNTVVSAANYLSKVSYVDAKHMGLQGHSRGGWETNYIVTHTNIFAAAMSSAGMSDYITLYNGTRSLSSGASRQMAFENSYQRIGATLWQRPDLFIENSPIFSADKVATPVLMMANKEDNDVPFEQSVEFFTALRRLGKRAWMLQYDGESHVIFDKAAADRSVRMKQFFDHYLKGEPAPKWMLYGVPASEKGNPDALQLVYEKDKNGKWLTPGPGLLKTKH